MYPNTAGDGNSVAPAAPVRSPSDPPARDYTRIAQTLRAEYRMAGCADTLPLQFRVSARALGVMRTGLYPADPKMGHSAVRLSESWVPAGDSLAFPVRDAGGAVAGIYLHSLDGHPSASVGAPGVIGPDGWDTPSTAEDPQESVAFVVRSVLDVLALETVGLLAVALAGPDYDADLRVLVATIHARPLTDRAWIPVGEREWAERAAQALHGAGVPVVSWQTPPYLYSDIHGWVSARLPGTFAPFDEIAEDGEARFAALRGRLVRYLEVESRAPHDGVWHPDPRQPLPDRPRGRMSEEMEDALLGRRAYWRHLTPAARARNGADEREVDAAVRVYEAAQAGDVGRYRREVAEAAALSRKVDAEAAAFGAAARAAFAARSLQVRGVTAAPPEEARPRPLGRGRVTRFGNTHELPSSAGEVPLSANQIAADLADSTDGWPRRVDGDLFVRDGFRPLWLDEVPALFAWIGRQFGGPGRTLLDENNVVWPGRPGLVTKGEFFSHLQQAAQAYEAVESFPHQPALAGHYYLHPAPCDGDGAALEEFLAFFSPATRHDRALMRAALLTLIWGGPPGQRPAFTITSDAEVTRDDQKGRGAGKTTFVRKTAELLGGFIDVRPTHTAEAITKRLLSPEARGRRMVLIDNIRSPRFAWDDLEAMLTAPVISGHKMYASEGRRPNTLTWFLTMNGGPASAAH